MPVPVGWGLVCGWMIGCFVGCTAFFNWLLNEHRPLWVAAVIGFVAFLGVALLPYARQRGWIKFALWDTAQQKEREKELAAAREQVLAEARAKRSA